MNIDPHALGLLGFVPMNKLDDPGVPYHLWLSGSRLYVRYSPGRGKDAEGGDQPCWLACIRHRGVSGPEKAVKTVADLLAFVAADATTEGRHAAFREVQAALIPIFKE